MMITLKVVAQIVVGLGLLNVWLVRSNKLTAFRGGDAKSMKEEFNVYGLPSLLLYIVGGFKVIAALLLLIGIWTPTVTAPAASVVGVLMIGAILMHLKVRDPMVKSLPAISILALTLFIYLAPI